MVFACVMYILYRQTSQFKITYFWASATLGTK